MESGIEAASEEELLARVSEGDAAALRVLYRAYERPLFALGVRWYGDRALAEELVQDVTLTVWRKAGQFDPGKGRASAWIFGIARNAATDLARAKLRRPVPVEELPEGGGSPWEADEAWHAWEVAKAVRTLPIEQQRVVELAFVQQFTQTEIASALGIPLGTVKTRVRLALAKLEEQFSLLGLMEGVQ